ncbi:MAG: tetratricopeptide repeat protein [Cyclobacteriaceae bacterium]
MDELTFERIESYLQGTLTPAEREQFEADMRKDETLREEVTLQRQLISSIETESVRQLLENIHEENFSEVPVEEEEETPVVPMQPRRRLPYMAVAASVALLVLAGWWFFMQQSPSPESLYAAYFTPAAGLPTTLGYSENTDFAEGMVSYKMEEYAEAVQWWQPLLQADPTNDTLNYYLGVASLANEQAPEAIDYLTQVIETSSSVYNADAQWYLALAYLQNNEVEPAKALLTELSQREGAYREQSRELLEEL